MKHLYVLFALGPAILAGLLLFCAVTWRGTFFAVTALVLLTLPLILLSQIPRGKKGLATLGTVILVAMLALTAPRIPEFNGQTGITQRSSGSAFSLFAWLPEVDQMVLGSYPMMFVDRHLDSAHATRLRTLLPTIYGPLKFMGSNLGDVATPHSGQMYIALPEHLPNEKLPLVIYLHGSGGAFVGYQTLLYEWAKAGHFIVVSPGFGFGNWNQLGGLEAVEAARKWAEENLPVDKNRVALVGLSNGGRAITRLIQKDETNRWPLVVALSAVMETDLIDSHWSGKKVLVLHGQEDERIPLEYVTDAVSEMKANGANVEMKTWPKEDHFLWFSTPNEIQTKSVEWLLKRWKSDE
jgi:pimeloyl-ACP methyl ester carboxylesterase